MFYVQWFNIGNLQGLDGWTLGCASPGKATGITVEEDPSNRRTDLRKLMWALLDRALGRVKNAPPHKLVCHSEPELSVSASFPCASMTTPSATSSGVATPPVPQGAGNPTGTPVLAPTRSTQAKDGGSSSGSLGTFGVRHHTIIPLHLTD